MADVTIVVPLADTIDLAGFVPVITIPVTIVVPLADTINLAGFVPVITTGVTIVVPLADTIDAAVLTPVFVGLIGVGRGLGMTLFPRNQSLSVGNRSLDMTLFWRR